MNQAQFQTAYQKLRKLGTVTTPYRGRTRFEPSHPGVDVANKVGTKIPSFTDGTVVGVDSGHKNGENNYGNSVMIQDDRGNKHRYSHLHNAYVSPGQRVHRGQPVAEMGASGAAYSPSGGDPSHLDYRVVSAYGKYKNPLPFIARTP